MFLLFFRICEKKAKTFFKQEWIKKYPVKRKRDVESEIYAHEYWAGHLVYRTFKQKIEKKKELDDKRQMITRIMEANNRKLNSRYDKRQRGNQFPGS